jgi:hypothetical protein
VVYGSTWNGKLLASVPKGVVTSRLPVVAPLGRQPLSAQISAIVNVKHFSLIVLKEANQHLSAVIPSEVEEPAVPHHRHGT